MTYKYLIMGRGWKKLLHLQEKVNPEGFWVEDGALFHEEERDEDFGSFNELTKVREAEDFEPLRVRIKEVS